MCFALGICFTLQGGRQEFAREGFPRLQCLIRAMLFCRKSQAGLNQSTPLHPTFFLDKLLSALRLICLQSFDDRLLQRHCPACFASCLSSPLSNKIWRVAVPFTQRPVFSSVRHALFSQTRYIKSLQTKLQANHSAETASATSTKHLFPLSTSDARSTNHLHFYEAGQLHVFHYVNNNTGMRGRSQYR